MRTPLQTEDAIAVTMRLTYHYMETMTVLRTTAAADTMFRRNHVHIPSRDGMDQVHAVYPLTPYSSKKIDGFASSKFLRI
jgi:hypothetical protein